jgi:hypothetical protein
VSVVTRGLLRGIWSTLLALCGLAFLVRCVADEQQPWGVGWVIWGMALTIGTIDASAAVRRYRLTLRDQLP